MEQNTDLEVPQQVLRTQHNTFLPTLGLHISLDWHHCSCVCLPATAQSFLKTPVGALEAPSLITGQRYSFWGRAIHRRPHLGDGGDLIS